MDASLEWNEEKNATLKARYGIGFEDVSLALKEGRSLGVRSHPNRERYPHQQQLLVLIENYVWVVPFVRRERGVFLKTLFPSRKATRQIREKPDA